ncbi:GNAT family N-acetyltransferase [Salinibacillus xinjiangensis]|uniref:GNAT family N-acetyltransferase n=1 Tax=Salinibacillus xinjiangensis TaxID=1229268 RepID=A0A6G1X4T8_9BACI|nr:GNAT family N-acetyltransferase [Salinibacillus xinjiangensis]MRG86013.1 GNAT family N-acetyltransferase [Salinibacillus xinjiangensis]
MKIRQLKVEDCQRILPIMNDWWGGREMTHLLPRFLFDNFYDTSFVIEKDDNIIGFLIGFLSQSNKEEAYIHLVGVNPKNRREGVGSTLYNQFFTTVKKSKVKRVRCITSPVNKNSIDYHTNIGFSIVEGDKLVDEIPVHTNYDGKGNERVLFVKSI